MQMAGLEHVGISPSAIGDGAVIQADPGTGFALDDGLDIFQRADHRRAASVAGELAGGLHLRPHGAGGKAEFVGHPMAQTMPLDDDHAAARAKLGVAAETVVFALLPGSRVSEIDYMAPLFFQTAFLMTDGLNHKIRR